MVPFEGMPISSMAQLLRKSTGLMANAALLLEVKSEEDLLPPGALPGTVPTDLEQATGLERLEILGKMQGVDIFDMKPLDASRKGKRSAQLQLDAHNEQLWS